MSGLILSALGKSISDAGHTMGTLMLKGYDDQLKAKRELDRDERTAQRQMERDERTAMRQAALEELKTELAAQKEESLKQRIISESSQVTKRADAMGRSREAKAFDKLAESSAQAGEQGDMALSKEELAAAVKQNPALGQQYKAIGLIDSAMPLTRNQQLSQRANDEVQAGMDIGAHSSLMKALQDKREATLKEIREENKQRNEEDKTESDRRRLDLMEQRNQNWREVKDRQGDQRDRALDQAGQRISQGGGGSSSEAITLRGLQAEATASSRAVNSARLALAAQEKASASAFGERRAEAEVALKAARGEMAEANRKHAAAQDALTAFNAKRGGGAAPDNSRGAITGLPRGAVQIGTSGGKPVYETPDGKRFIAR